MKDKRAEEAEEVSLEMSQTRRTISLDNNRIIRYSCTNFFQGRSSRNVKVELAVSTCRSEDDNFGLSDAESRQGKSAERRMLNAEICSDNEAKFSIFA